MSSLKEINSDSILPTQVIQLGGSLNGLKKAFNSAEWKKEVSMILTDLERRIAELEKKSNFQINDNTLTSNEKTTLPGPVDSFTASGRYGLSGIPTCIHLVFSKRVASFQCLWLLVCIMLYISIGILQFIRAESNEESTWKPEKMDYIRDYTNGDLAEQYEMPEVYIFFGISAVDESTNWSPEKINTTFSDLLESQDFNSTSTITYLTPELDTIDDSLYCKDVQLINQGKLSNNSILAHFKIQLSDPDPSMGSFQFWITFDTDSLTLNKTLNISGFWVSVGRDDSKVSLVNLAYVDADEAFDKGTTLVHIVDYRESVHFRWKNSDPTYHIETSSAWQQDATDDIIFDSPRVYIAFRGNLMVKHWKEYVDFTYYDWFAAMGGLLSIFSLFFFIVAHHIAKKLSDGHSIGILPGLSVGFRNLEMISWMRAQLEERKILARKGGPKQDFVSLPSYGQTKIIKL